MYRFEYFFLQIRESLTSSYNFIEKLEVFVKKISSFRLTNSPIFASLIRNYRWNIPSQCLIHMNFRFNNFVAIRNKEVGPFRRSNKLFIIIWSDQALFRVQYNTFDCKMRLFVDKKTKYKSCKLIHRKNKSLHFITLCIHLLANR